MRRHSSRSSALLVALLASAVAAGEVGAQTINFDDIVGSNYTLIPTTYGSTATLSVTNQARTTLGNGSVSGGLCLWLSGYGDLLDNAFTCSAGAGVGEFTFTPAAGYQVTLNSFDVGEYVGRVPGTAEVRVFDLALSSTLFTGSQALGATGHWTVTPNLTSSSGLVLQWGDNWDYGIDNISVTVAPLATTPVPEPMTIALVGAGLVALAGVARARRTA